MNPTNRKQRRIIIALSLTLSLLGLSVVPPIHACPGQCCVQPDMRGHLYDQREARISGPNTCCCTGEAGSCEISKGPVQDRKILVGFAIQRLEKPTPLKAGSIATSPGLGKTNSLRRAPGKVSTSAGGWSVPLYLLNLSFLC
jgi:hypothetical protein